MEAIRVLKQRQSDMVLRQMLREIQRLETGPGGQPGRLGNPARLTKPRGQHFGTVTSRTRRPPPWNTVLSRRLRQPGPPAGGARREIRTGGRW